MIIDNAGTYTLRYTATDECGNSTTVDRELVVQNLPYGVEWDGSESSAWTRIGKSASFSDPVPQYSDGNGGWIGGSSPFDNIMPWSGMQIVEDAEAGTLVSIPKFYYKWTHGLGANGNGLRLEISDSPQDGFFTSPAHADRGDGVGERDFVYVGRYNCATGYKSQTGVSPLARKTRATFRSGIHGLGSDIWQFDFAMYWTICMLYLVEFADWNSQAKIGGGCSDSGSVQAMGITDSMTYHTGTTNTAVGATNYGHIQYRHIEDLWANVYDWCDGIYFSGADVYAINNPANFSDNANGTLVGQRAMASDVPQTFIEPTANGYEYALYPATVNGSDYTVRTCDRCNNNFNGVVLCVGGYYSQNQVSGLFSLGGNYTDSDQGNVIGSRLMKLPSA